MLYTIYDNYNIIVKLQTANYIQKQTYLPLLLHQRSYKNTEALKTLYDYQT